MRRNQSFLCIGSHLLKKFLTRKVIFCAFFEAYTKDIRGNATKCSIITKILLDADW